jgi:hypothetical protein
MKYDEVISPTLSILIKLGSIAVHADELHPNGNEIISPLAHPYDIVALRSILDDPEIKEWLVEMDKMAFLPKKR